MNRIGIFVTNILLTILVAIPTSAQTVLRRDTGKLRAKQEIVNASIGRYNSIEENGLAKSVFQEKPALKSRGRAFLKSLLLPGWGQHYAESKKSMRLFILTEALTVGSYFGFSTWSHWLEDDYRAFAVTHAGINLDGKGDSYFVDIGNFNNLVVYNQAQLRDRDLVDVYRDTKAFNWQWDNNQNREKFEDLRIRSDRAANNSEFALAAIVLNHLVSAIHSTLSVYKYNKKISKHEIGFDLKFMYNHRNETLVINISKTL